MGKDRTSKIRGSFIPLNRCMVIQQSFSIHIYFRVVATRLVGGATETSGRLEMEYDGVWRTVSRSKWSGRNSAVVCRNMGYEGTALLIENTFGEGTGQVFMTDVVCGGKEDALEDCELSKETKDLDHSQDVALSCSNDRGM